MVESQRTLTKPQLYEGLIDRLGRALTPQEPQADCVMNGLWNWSCEA